MTPGDSCLAGHGVGVHIFRGASTGIVFTDDHLECDLYRCVIGDGSTYGCHSFSPPVYASASVLHPHTCGANRWPREHPALPL